jgi:peptidoglycan hydrolase CwlO-like protein
MVLLGGAMKKYIIGIVIVVFIGIAYGQSKHTVPDNQTNTVQINFKDQQDQINQLKIEVKSLQKQVDSLRTSCCN